MGMVAILFKRAELFEQIDTIPLTEGPMWNLVENWSSGFRKEDI